MSRGSSERSKATAGAAPAPELAKQEPAPDLDGRARAFREEAQALGFVYTCDACVHFAPADQPARCSLGYPLNQGDDERSTPIVDDSDWTFCKYFELN